MSVGRICVRSVATAYPSETARAAARRMRERDLGTLVVVDESGVPIGILTDRDLMLRFVAGEDDAGVVEVAQLMSTPVTTAGEESPIEDALAQMAAANFRRLPVVDASGRLVGLLALDDVIDLLGEEVATIRSVLRRRSGKERRS